jgi:putative two-component system response regulator
MNNSKSIVLAVDDTSLNLRAMKIVLDGDYDVRLAKSGEMALEMLKNIKIEIVLLDIEMPGMSGFDVIDEMKKDPGMQDIPVIFITSHAAPDFIVTAYEHGARDFIVKPIRPDVLLNKVSALLEKK